MLVSVCLFVCVCFTLFYILFSAWFLIFLHLIAFELLHSKSKFFHIYFYVSVFCRLKDPCIELINILSLSLSIHVVILYLYLFMFMFVYFSAFFFSFLRSSDFPIPSGCCHSFEKFSFAFDSFKLLY